MLGVRGPYGRGWEVSDGAGGDVVVVAGGIGLAPLRAAVLEVAASRDRFGTVHVLHGARTEADVLFGDELLAWATGADLEVAVTSTGPPPPGPGGSAWSPSCSAARRSTRSGRWRWSAAPR